MACCELLSTPNKEALDKLIVGQHRRNHVLRLRRHEPEARHLPCTADNGIVIRVNDTDSKPGEPHILGEAVDDVDQVSVAAGVVFDHFGDADESRLGEDSGGVDFVAHQVDVFVVDECNGGFERFPVVNCAKWI